MIAEFDVQMLGDPIEVENMEMATLFPCASNETHPNFAKILSRDIHCWRISLAYFRECNTNNKTFCFLLNNDNQNQLNPLNDKCS